jgi:hypothetical protein
VTRKAKLGIGLLVVVALLVAARLALPYVVKDYVNKQLVALEAYDGHVDDIDIHLYRGAYSIDGIEIVKTGAKRPVPFFKAGKIDLSVEWRSLWKGSIVSEASFYAPEINLVQVTNLTNVVESGKETFADFHITANVLDGAPARVAGSVNAFAPQPTFDVNMEVKNVQLPQANPWLREYIKADAEAGKFELYMELAAADGKFAGYAKPILEDVDLYRSGEPEKNPIKRVWEGFLDFAANVLENPEADQVAARIPFTGTIKDPETNLFATIASVLRNAFVSAFARSLEGSITLRDVKSNLRDIDPNAPAEEEKKPDEKDDDKRKPKPGPAGKT